MEVHLLQHIWIWLDTQEILVSVETRGKRDTGCCILMAMNETKRKVSENSVRILLFQIYIAYDFIWKETLSIRVLFLYILNSLYYILWWSYCYYPTTTFLKIWWCSCLQTCFYFYKKNLCKRFDLFGNKRFENYITYFSI